ncbi:hypothetical protein N7447_009316 [Penicillium robsamsonii]|uniref:uncharacterized protein n=1 Tax=Penicillium robsamsonii TaxID=1792511 RepID=UPI0025485B7B|nr:uncharacterized protein N7447_009316 [Penicillium robsamsonii]KAJ5817083.1 hypothetical protein N7447_009316 [Penicillium robsamsonii]
MKPPFRRAASPSVALAERTAPKSLAASFWHCDLSFDSRNGLHAHLHDKDHSCQQPWGEPQGQIATVGEDGSTNREYKLIIESNRKQSSTKPEQAYKTWRYLPTTAGLPTPDNKRTICLDSGCLMALIDSSLANSLHLKSHDTPDIPVAGIGSKHTSSRYVNLPIFFHNEHNVAKVTVEAMMHEVLRFCLAVHELGCFAADFASSYCTCAYSKDGRGNGLGD